MADEWLTVVDVVSQKDAVEDQTEPQANGKDG